MLNLDPWHPADDVEHTLHGWASWHKSGGNELLKQWWQRCPAWAKQSVTNMMTAEDDGQAAWEREHSHMMRLIDVAIDNLKDRQEWAWYAVHKVHGLGTMGIESIYAKCSLFDLYQSAKPLVKREVERKNIICGIV
jgi:hypothetical protein